MSRRRYISTDISLDARVNRLGVDYGDFAVLLYTWMIPHAKDDATIRGTPEELLFTIVPGRRDKTEKDVIDALIAMETLGLIEWQRDACLILFPSDSFYRHQTYVQPKNRRLTDSSVPYSVDSENQRETPRNAENHNSPLQSAEIAASPSPSPSPSLSAAANARTRENAAAAMSNPLYDEERDAGEPAPTDEENAFRQVCALLDIIGNVSQERRLFDRMRRWGILSPVAEHPRWHEERGYSRSHPTGRVTSFCDWMDIEEEAARGKRQDALDYEEWKRQWEEDVRKFAAS